MFIRICAGVLIRQTASYIEAITDIEYINDSASISVVRIRMSGHQPAHDMHTVRIADGISTPVSGSDSRLVRRK